MWARRRRAFVNGKCSKVPIGSRLTFAWLRAQLSGRRSPMTAVAQPRSQTDQATEIARLEPDEARGDPIPFVQASIIVSQTVTAIWERQARLFLHETEHAMKGVGSLGAMRDPSMAVPAYLDTLHSGVESAVTDMREIN